MASQDVTTSVLVYGDDLDAACTAVRANRSVEVAETKKSNCPPRPASTARYPDRRRIRPDDPSRLYCGP